MLRTTSVDSISGTIAPAGDQDWYKITVDSGTKQLLRAELSGLGNDAGNPVSPELLAWSDLIFVMEKAHRNKFSKKFRAHVTLAA